MAVVRAGCLAARSADLSVVDWAVPMAEPTADLTDMQLVDSSVALRVDLMVDYWAGRWAELTAVKLVAQWAGWSVDCWVEQKGYRLVERSAGMWVYSMADN